MKKGTLLKVTTKTFEDVCGEVLYEVVETGLLAPEKERKAAGIKDGVKCVMLGGSGPAARPGWTIIDSEDAINRNIKDDKANLAAFRCIDMLNGSPQGNLSFCFTDIKR